ncbi:MAG: hypothetical protein E7449_01080 [Ruminococcaceae bacterium]|nr:hypothetical protein [Oscillospiraceae bacterium]
MEREKISITEEVYAPVLKTGDRFIAQPKNRPAQEYEFVGYAPFDGCGCQYIIIKNVETGDYAGVERLWFNEEYCGRKITLLKEE